jgi:hypothetical protein
VKKDIPEFEILVCLIVLVMVEMIMEVVMVMEMIYGLLLVMDHVEVQMMENS